MLDVPFASSDLTFDGAVAPEQDITFPSIAWQPRLVLVPAWRLDAKARVLKRLVDVAGALTGLVLLALPAFGLMLAIWLESPGPVLFRQRRVGLLGEPFTLLK